jgi:hypothetical protein
MMMTQGILKQRGSFMFKTLLRANPSDEKLSPEQLNPIPANEDAHSQLHLTI